jgi:hypothetical protein
LVSVVPEALRKEENQARAGVDFFVSTYYLSFLFAILALAVALSSHVPNARLACLVMGVGAGCSMFLWYRFAILSTRYWGGTVQAMVNIGRKGLASSLDLTMPATADEEQQMWASVTEMTDEPSLLKHRELDAFRSVTSENAAEGGEDHATNAERLTAPD